MKITLDNKTLTIALLIALVVLFLYIAATFIQSNTKVFTILTYVCISLLSFDASYVTYKLTKQNRNLIVFAIFLFIMSIIFLVRLIIFII
jgi:hypothetical protein